MDHQASSVDERRHQRRRNNGNSATLPGLRSGTTSAQAAAEMLPANDPVPASDRA